MANTFEQNAFFIGAAVGGTVQMVNVGKSDDGTPIFYELETQELEFGNRATLKKIADEIGVIGDNGLNSILEVRSDTQEYTPVPMTMNARVNIGKNIDTEGHYFTFRWFGEVDQSSPILEGLYLENITDFGITQP
ncbi:MAG: hypothetical protein V4436_02225 [Patescibacteria group bacterium]